MRLGRRGLLAGHFGRRHGQLDDRPGRVAGLPVEDIEERLLGRLRQSTDRLAVDDDVGEHGRGREVEVPEAVVDGLEVPPPLAALGVEGEDRLGEQALARAVAAVPVVARGAGGGVDHPEFLVAAHPGPDVRGAGLGRFGAVPRVEAELAGLGDDVEAPAQGAGPRVVAADDPGWVAAPRPGVGCRFAEYDHIAADHGRGGPEVLPATDALPCVQHVDPAAVAELRVAVAGVRVERGQPAVADKEQPPRGPVVPGHAASHGEPPHVPGRLVLEGVIGPQDLAAGRIERGRSDAGGHQHPAVAHHRRVLEQEGRENAFMLRGEAVVDRLPAPGDLELVDVRLVDLVERRVLAAPAVRGVVVPFAGAG